MGDQTRSKNKALALGDVCLTSFHVFSMNFHIPLSFLIKHYSFLVQYHRITQDVAKK